MELLVAGKSLMLLVASRTECIPMPAMSYYLKCAYSKEYVTSNNGEEIVYICPYPPINGKTMCYFHDNDFFKDENNHDEIMRELKKHLEKFLLTQENELKCIGFNIPAEFKLGGTDKSPLVIRQHVNFTRAKFYDKVTFENITFEKNAIFSYSNFKKVAIFSSNRFKGEALFSHVQFEKKLEFKGQPNLEQPNLERRNHFENFTNFYHTRFDDYVDFSGTEFTARYDGDEQVNLSHIDFSGEVDFDSSPYQSSMFPHPPQKYRLYAARPAITFNDTTFRKRVRFKGDANRKLELGLVSFTNVNLTNVEFYNINWLKMGVIFSRQAIIDEAISDHCTENNQDEKCERIIGEGRFKKASSVYDNLRQNQESHLSFNEASDFFIGRMETERKRLEHLHILERLRSAGYLVYKLLNLYGESTYLPLLWSLVIIIVFALIRNAYGICSDIPESSSCSFQVQLFDSLAAFFQFPRSEDIWIDTLERIVSLPILGMAIKSFASTKRFENLR